MKESIGRYSERAKDFFASRLEDQINSHWYTTTTMQQFIKTDERIHVSNSFWYYGMSGRVG